MEEVVLNMQHPSISRERRMEYYTGKVFVVLKKSSDMEKIIGEATDQNTVVNLCKIAFCCKKRETLGGDTSNEAAAEWYFERADEPWDIIWHNMG